MNRRDFLKSWSAACVAVGIVPGLVLPDKEIQEPKQIANLGEAGLFGGVPVVYWTLAHECLDAELRRLDLNYEPKHFRTTGNVDVFENNSFQVGEKQKFILYKGNTSYSGTGMIVANTVLCLIGSDVIKSEYEFIVEGVVSESNV